MNNLNKCNSSYRVQAFNLGLCYYKNTLNKGYYFESMLIHMTFNF